MSEIRDYQVDHLLLLVGSNPLPNVVAGKLLTTTSDTITLIHSADGLDLAQRLKSWFLIAGYADTNIGFKQVEETNAASVSACVYKVLKEYEGKVVDENKNDSGNANKVHMFRVGLNYTGGTKVMSVHAHLAMESWINDTRRHAIFSRDPVFSYLDARTLQMRFDPSRGRPAISFDVGRRVEIGISELLALHNWEPIKAPITVPVLPESAGALLTVQSNPTEARIWSEWLRDELFRKGRKPVRIPPPIWVSQSGKEVQEQLERPASNDKWKSKTDLQKLEISWPNLLAMRDTMSKELGQDGSKNLKLTTVMGSSRRNEAEEFCKWLSGIWLESAVLSALQHCPPELQLKECCMDIKPKVLGRPGGELFQFDVAAIRGYQLFAFSCTTESANESGGKALLKHKLFEAYVRARQMGGDEACAALVCCMTQEQADELEAEMRRDIILKGRIKVFGRDHLANLTRHIEDWIREQSRDRKQSKED